MLSFELKTVSLQEEKQIKLRLKGRENWDRWCLWKQSQCESNHSVKAITAWKQSVWKRSQRESNHSVKAITAWKQSQRESNHSVKAITAWKQSQCESNHSKREGQASAETLGSGQGWLSGYSAGLLMERLQVWSPAQAAEEFSFPRSTVCADSYFSIHSTPVLPQ